MFLLTTVSEKKQNYTKNMVLPVEIERRFGSAFHPYLEGA
jgi:hypothetical protein